MRKIIFIIITLTSFQTLFSQKINNKISIDFNNVNRRTAIQEIEKATDYKFYFNPKWLSNDTITISKSYKEATINNILNGVFEDTNLNYYITNNKVILTQNLLIYDKLPIDYFVKTEENDSKKKQTESNSKPIFYKEKDSLELTEKAIITTTLIGKEKKKSETKLYTISGHVKDKKTKKPLSNISISAQEKKINTVTDSEGYYSIQLPSGVNYLQIESVNFEKTIRKVIIYDNGKLDVSISESINELNEVLIKGKGNKNVRTAITGVSSINVEGIKNVPLVLGERDIFRVAATLPGIKTTGEGSAGFNVRGGKDDQNLILLDNAVLYNTSHFLGFFSAVNPYTTSKVDIYKGSIPAQFGGRLSSVFDISTKKANTEKVSGEGGIGSVTSNLSIGTPIVKGKSSLLVGVRGTYSEWILNSLKEESLKNSEAAFFDGTLKYNHKINDNNNIESTLYYSHDKFSISSDSLYKYSNRLFSLKWDHNFNSKNKAAVIFTNSEYKFNIDYNAESDNSFDFGYKLNESQLQLNLQNLFSAKHTFNYGISSKLYNIDPGYLNPKKIESTLIPINVEDEKGLESAAYFSDNFNVSEKLLLSLGLRYSFYAALGESTQRVYQDNLPMNDATVIATNTYKNNEVIKTYGGFEPRLAIRYLVNDDFSVKTSYDKTFQFIHLLTNNTTQSPTDAWKLSDLNIAPQEAQQFSLGFYKNIDQDLLEISLEGYYKKSKNLLDYKVGGDLVLNENIETEILQGDGKAYGVELLLKKQYGRLNGWIGYTYSRTFIKFDSEFNDEKVNNGKYFPTNFDKPHEVSTVLNYKITQRYSFSGNFIYQSGRPITYPIGTYDYGNASYTLYSDRNKFRIPDYYRLDIGFNIEGNHKIKKLAHSFWNISIYNVLGRNNPYSIFFVTEEGKVKAYKTSIFAIPIPSITYNFKF
ncbi:TonB-dependent receptor [Flavobacterium sp. A45]|uniref:TonB-dependent receptor n=1 Tax=Flavobacterium sp. A45 TaxID=1945862 RepID=UPI000984E76E|nr:TonB-dependent receptor [Flavobacterium sp. A45]OOG76574.1 TonB-dependent receptor [Flavobacterium sp. A45]